MAPHGSTWGLFWTRSLLCGATQRITTLLGAMAISPLCSIGSNNFFTFSSVLMLTTFPSKVWPLREWLGARAITHLAGSLSGTAMHGPSLDLADTSLPFFPFKP